MASTGVNLRVAPTVSLKASQLAALKRFLEAAYDEPFVEDWDHALGGVHFLIEEGDDVLAHASVVERWLETELKRLRTGYVEAVATRPDRQRAGFGSRVMQRASDYIRAEFELGGLSTGENAFYARFGWETWRGPTFVRTSDGLERTAGEDGSVMILRTPLTPSLNLAESISCEWRAGDVW